MNHFKLFKHILTALPFLFVAYAANAQTTPQPGFDAGIAADWKRILAEGDFKELMATYVLANALSDNEGEPIVENCRQKAADIDAALGTNPIGIGLWYAAYQCAEELNDVAQSDLRRERFGALVRHAFAARPDDSETTPIRILADADVWAFVAASGQELLYDYYDPFINRRHLVRVVGLWDEDAKRERMLSFDFLDSVVQLTDDKPEARFPSYRRALIEAFLKSFHDLGLPAATQGYEVLQALRLPTLAERIDAMEQYAQNGNYAAALNLLSICEHLPQAGCGQRGVDVVLPYVELRLSNALVLLANTYARGKAVQRDLKSADALLDAADARLGDMRGRKMLAALSMALSEAETTWPLLRKSMQRAARDGDRVAALVVAVNEVLTTRRQKPSKRSRAQLLHAAESGLSHAQLLHGLLLIDEKQFEEGYKWVERAAEAGNTQAQNSIGQALMSGSRIQKDTARGLRWLQQAGDGGIADAMRAVALHYSQPPATAENRGLEEGWLRSASQTGDAEASLQLARLIGSGGADESGRKEALNILRHLVGRTDLAEQDVGKRARALLAGVLALSVDTDESRKEAIALLEPLAEKGDVEFQAELGSIYVTGDDLKLRSTGIEWLRKAADSGNMSATESLAYASWLGRGIAPDPKAASVLWQRAVDAKYLAAYNNWGWVLCTWPEPGLRDAKRGIALLQELDKLQPLSWGSKDSLAACHAADGAFPDAIKLQQEVIAATKAQGSDAGLIGRLEARLALYQDGKIYTESEPDNGDAADSSDL